MVTREPAAVAPRGSYSRGALRELGVDIESVEGAAATPLRAAVASALAGIRTRPTPNNPEGVSRGVLIGACSRRHAFKVGDAFILEPKCCRQRACPACARARARQNAADLVRSIQHRRKAAASSMFLFATFTQPKRPRREETPFEATRRIVLAFRRISNPNTVTGREFRRLFKGGLRTTEVTYSAAGDHQRNGGGAVAFSGYHAHLHCMIEVREGIVRSEAAGWLLRAWLAEVEGAAAGAQCIRAANEADAHELCKYVTKPLEDSRDKPAILRELFGALHGVRLLQAFGEWMGREGVRVGWRELGADEQPPSAPRYRGPEIGDLRRIVYEQEQGRVTGRVPFVGYTPGDEQLVYADEAWTAIAAAVRARAASQSQRMAGAAKPRPRPPPD